MNVSIYTRVSTQDQDVASQLLELRGYCARQGWSIASEFSDVMSGSKAVRPGLEALLASKPEAILVVKLDRLGRSLLNVAVLVKKLDDMGVALICSSQGIDTRKDNPCGRFQLNMLSAVAEFERSLIRERTKAGLAVARSSGKILGRPSPTLLSKSQWPEIFASWEIGGRAGGYRGLGALLRCSAMTARRLLKQHTAISFAEVATAVTEEAW